MPPQAKATNKGTGCVWSFDLGLGSIGEAVRDAQTQQFKHVASLILPADFANTKEQAAARRMHRTRLAHKRREAWLDKVWREAGQEPLAKRTVHRNAKTRKFELKHPGDPRLEREFPAQGDKTTYTSCLLRIKLLQGEKLEPWQIYKALHSAIQRRGYDPSIPWKDGERADKKAKSEEQQEYQSRLTQFAAELQSMTKDKARQLPCYFDAWKMGLWDPAKPKALRERIDHLAESPRGQIIPRTIVEEEIRQLVRAAGKQIPGLAGKEDYVLYGPAGRAYASWYPELRRAHKLRLGSHTDTQGVLSQRIPRFDNRIISKCALIPRLNVCKIVAEGPTKPTPQTKVVFDATFLLRLKNMRAAKPDGTPTSLSAEQIRTIFEDPARKSWSMTKTDWKKACKAFGLAPLLAQREVAEPKTSGRSRFCRPALDIVGRLILSGKSPAEFHAEEMKRLGGNTDPRKGLVKEDLDFLLKMGESWAKIHVPDQQLDAILQLSEDPEAAVRTIIGQQNNPVVRHRLELFFKRLCLLRERFGEPESVAVEFVREDFMGAEARSEYRAFVKRQTEKRAEAQAAAKKAKLKGKAAPLKLQLLEEQGGICLYTGESLEIKKIDQYEIDHIVPRSRMGPDAPYNRVLTTHRTNSDEKGNRTPFEWLGGSAQWPEFLKRVESAQKNIRGKKARLLVAPDAEELVQKYSTLAETAWISRLARAILDATFGWRNGIDRNGRKRVIFVQGGLTARVRRKYRLNSILAPAPAGADPYFWEQVAEKNRADPRHHALDAMVLNFIPQWARDPSKEDFLKFPAALGKDPRKVFAAVLDATAPVRVAMEKPALAETIYGARKQGPQGLSVKRHELFALGMKQTAPGKVSFDLPQLRKQLIAIRDAAIRELVHAEAKKNLTEEKWRKFCDTFRLPGAGSKPGSRVRKVNMTEGTLEEYADLSKDGTGAYRKAIKGHKGQVLYCSKDGERFGVEPIYAHASVIKTVEAIKSTPGIKVLAVVQTGCLVSLKEEVSKHDHKAIVVVDKKQQRIAPKRSLEAGTYIWCTIQTASGQAVLAGRDGSRYAVHLRTLAAAGMERV
jgi:CRISPR-associated endonuclease Csn1